MTTLKSVAIAVGLCSSAFGQATSPVVGYETLDIKAGEFNLLGLRLHGKILVSGTFDSSGADSLTDSGADYSGFDAGSTYIVEFDGGDTVVATGASFSGDTLSGLSGDLSALLVDYSVREAMTLTDVFGSDNSVVGLAEATSLAAADVVWVWDGTAFQRYFYNPGQPPFVTEGWKNSSNNDADPAMVYTDGFLVQTRGGADLDLVVSGSVATEARGIDINEGFNYFSSVFPVGVTLDNSGLESAVASATSLADADVVWLWDGAAGSYSRYFYNPGQPPFVTEGWKDASNNEAGTTEMTSGFLIQRKAAGSASGEVTPPAIYTNL
ncbi:hypothetical protein [Roseibacillus persicicus]|uniref:hypothetical protein n=1 Tax=Roseibacillus persicicus TaxID=454148 RepID=UPI00280D88FD|nr:hypothetical protein [Roseibacillus persicicus]MDQ8189348.1 hypothetical protein [Roseibacillus persicicus]